MTASTKTKLRKIDTAKENNAIATYEATRDGQALGTITKFSEPAHGMAGRRDGVSRIICWEHSRDKGISYDRRKDALDALERAAGVEA